MYSNEMKVSVPYCFYARHWRALKSLHHTVIIHFQSGHLCDRMEVSVMHSHGNVIFLKKIQFSACKYMDSQHAITWTNSYNGMTHGVMQVNRCPDWFWVQKPGAIQNFKLQLTAIRKIQICSLQQLAPVQKWSKLSLRYRRKDVET